MGAGYTAREHVRAFADIPGVVLAGIFSRTRQRAEQLALDSGILVVCNSVTELYEKTNAELVVIAVPELSMNIVSQECFKFPWVILMEKPAGYDVADAEAIYQSAQARGSRVFVALNRRCYASTMGVLEDLDNLEGPRFIKVQDQQDQTQALTAGQPLIVVKNWMYANSIHLIDYFRLFGRGRVIRVQPIVPWHLDTPGVVISQIQFESGDLGVYEGIWNGPGPWAVTVTVPSKRWELRPLEQAAFQKRGERRVEIVEGHPWDKIFKPGFRMQAERAVAATRGGTSELPMLSDAMKTMQLISAVFSPSISEVNI